ncbi:flagellar hook-associated protein FlgL [Massilia sp. PAMC28688]|uniref:flagellar hook-associated protein FlgL n=1 Tax=Massilia sp. PAMC28688 TaxID=2861283 RepID=UPI001C639EC3|nr:flagellar hook-associated protein FlgL [Massilia sp. PAMC28688]QYF92019.1 flagellar hook-associated protein FlgL [Massilia sp. PAMC28688]
MRIATSTMYEAGTSQLGTLQSKMARTQQQLATQKRMLTAADDPIASARALEVTQSKSVNSQFAVNRQNARSSLSEVELSLTSATTLLQDVQSLAVKANNGVLSQADRESLAVELEGHLEDMFGIANNTDGSGNYLFAGFKSNTPPFAKVPGGAQYMGDQGGRQLQVSAARQVGVSDSGSAVFENNRTGNGTFVTSARAANTGTGVISSGAVVNAAAMPSTAYEITFAGSGSATTYSVIDKKTGLPPPDAVGPQPYSPDQQIAFGGLSFSVKGNPAAGDKFDLDPSSKQSVFKTMSDMIATLRAPAGNAAQLAQLSNGLNKATENLSSALDNVLGIRASVGARQKELDTLDAAGEDLDIQYAATLSNLQDLDMVAAITEFTQQQMTLEAAQKSFKSMSGLSLFNYIG